MAKALGMKCGQLYSIFLVQLGMCAASGKVPHHLHHVEGPSDLLEVPLNV